jgi:hypothetical protein
VTIGTGPVQEHEIGAVRSHLPGNDLVTLLHMTGRTKQGHPLSQQPLLPGAMARVAVIAPFYDGRVLPKKRSSLFLVAAQAERIRVNGPDQVFTAATVRVVTGTALHAGFAVLIPDQVCRPESHGIAFCFMAAAAALKLVRAGDTNWSIGPGMLRMATQTRKTIRLVR